MFNIGNKIKAFGLAVVQKVKEIGGAVVHNAKNLGLAAGLFAGSSVASRAVDTIDLTPVTGGISSMSTAVIAATTVVIGAGVGLAAIKWGARFLLGLFKSFAK